MRIKLTESVNGLIGDYRPGAIVDLPKARALKLIEQGRAAPIRTDATERAVVREPLETRTNG